MKKVTKTAKKMVVGKKGQRGFTLIELLIVIGILAVVAAVAIPNLTKFMGKGKQESWSSDRNTIQTSVLAFRSDYTNDWPKEDPLDVLEPYDIDMDLLVNGDATHDGGYLTEIPKSSDQYTAGDAGSYNWQINDEGQVTTTYVSGTYP